MCYKRKLSKFNSQKYHCSFTISPRLSMNSFKFTHNYFSSIKKIVEVNSYKYNYSFNLKQSTEKYKESILIPFQPFP